MALKGHIVSEETKNKISIGMKGNKNSFGHKVTENHKKRLSEIHTGKIVSQETRGKMSEAHKGMYAGKEISGKLLKSR